MISMSPSAIYHTDGAGYEPALPRGRGTQGGTKMSVKIRGIEFEGNLDNPMRLQFYNLSHRFGY